MRTKTSDIQTKLFEAAEPQLPGILYKIAQKAVVVAVMAFLIHIWQMLNLLLLTFGKVFELSVDLLYLEPGL